MSLPNPYWNVDDVVTSVYKNEDDPEKLKIFRKYIEHGPHPLSLHLCYPHHYFRALRAHDDVACSSSDSYYASDIPTSPQAVSLAYQLTHEVPTLETIIRELGYNIGNHSELWTQRSAGLSLYGDSYTSLMIVDNIINASNSNKKPLSLQFHNQMTDTYARNLMAEGCYLDAIVSILGQTKELDVDSLFLASECAFHIGDWLLAVTSLVQLMKDSPRYTRAWTQLHDVLFKFTEGFVTHLKNNSIDLIAPLPQLDKYLSHQAYSLDKANVLETVESIVESSDKPSDKPLSESENKTSDSTSKYYTTNEHVPADVYIHVCHMFGLDYQSLPQITPESPRIPLSSPIAIVADLIFLLFSVAHRITNYAVTTCVASHTISNPWTTECLHHLLSYGYERVHTHSGCFGDAVGLCHGEIMADMVKWGHTDAESGECLLKYRRELSKKDTVDVVNGVFGDISHLEGSHAYVHHPVMDLISPHTPLSIFNSENTIKQCLVTCVDNVREAVVWSLERQYLMLEPFARNSPRKNNNLNKNSTSVTSIDEEMSENVGTSNVMDSVVAYSIQRVIVCLTALRKNDVDFSRLSNSLNRHQLLTKTGLERVISSPCVESWLGGSKSKLTAQSIADIVAPFTQTIGDVLEATPVEYETDERMIKPYWPLYGIHSILSKGNEINLNYFKAFKKSQKGNYSKFYSVKSDLLENLPSYNMITAVCEDFIACLTSKALMPKLPRTIYFGYNVLLNGDELVHDDAEDTIEVFKTTTHQVNEVEEEGRNRPKPMNPKFL